MTETVPFTAEYADDAAELERVCFSAPWTAEQIKETLSNPCAVYFAALVDGAFAGYAGMYAVSAEGEITNIAVSPVYRRRGVASALISALAEAGRKAGLSKLCLDVRVSNAAALSLYEKNGFYRVGLRRGYYSAPKEDAVLLDKDL